MSAFAVNPASASPEGAPAWVKEGIGRRSAALQQQKLQVELWLQQILISPRVKANKGKQA